MQFGSDPSHQPCVEEAGLDFGEIVAVANSEAAVRQQLSLEQLSRKIKNPNPEFLFN